MNGSSRDPHQLDSHQRQNGVAPIGGVGAEVLDELLAALARIDAPAVQQERFVESMPATKRSGVRAQGIVLGLGVLVGMRIAGGRELRGKIDAAADRLFRRRVPLGSVPSGTPAPRRCCTPGRPVR